jgi:hypothetical protein
MRKAHRRPLEYRFWEKVEKRESHQCWFWRGSIATNGYGQFMWTDDRKPKRAHRVAYELVCGPIPNGLLVLHRCDVRRCCNPAHLFLGTAKENTQDMVQKGRAKGHPQGEQHPNARLTADQVREIRDWTGPKNEIAARFSISEAYVSNIRAGRKWKHLPLISPTIN